MTPDQDTLYWLLVAQAVASFLIHFGFILARPGWRHRLVEGKEGPSAWLIGLGVFGFYTLLGLNLALPATFHRFTWPFQWWLAIPGMLLLLAQLLYLVLAHRALGSSWSGSIFTYEGQKLVTSGIYAHVRHPIYVGVLFWALGAILVGHNVLFLWLLVAAAGVVLRVQAEERNLTDQFGDEWREHRKRTRMFL